MIAASPRASPPFFLALDAGTSAVKAALFDGEGRQQAVHAVEYELEHPAPHHVELDPEIYWQAALEAIASLLQTAAVPSNTVASLGITSQGETLIALDREGHPLRKAIVWLDNRANAEARDLAKSFDAGEVYRITGQQEIVPCWTAAKLLWLRKHEPEVFARAAKYLMVADYLVYRFTGRFVSDHALNPSTLYYDLVRGDWWETMLDYLELRRDQLPELVYSGTAVGPAHAGSGLDGRTLVATAPIDQVAGAVGAGNLAPGMVTETTGSVLALCATCDGPCYDPQRRIGLYRHALPAAYVLLPWFPTAGMIFRWFRDTMAPGTRFETLAQEAQAIPRGADGLTLLPHLNGAFLPAGQPCARGVFHGITLAHTRAHFVRAIFEAVAFMVKDALDQLEAAGVPLRTICSLGGGARSPLWLQIKADVTEREVVTTDTTEVAARGAAMLAAVAAGHYPDPAAAAGMVRYPRRFQPQPEAAAIYRDIHQRYAALNDLILPTFP